MTDELHLRIAKALTEPGKPVYQPTGEQRQIIEAPLEPTLVVAGAGSGKTHTLVLRILWMIATGQVRPSEVLGLTFTRKATGELRERLETGMRALRSEGIITADEFDVPIVSTYNSYANTIYRQYALLVGREPDATVLDQPAATSLMRQVVIESDDVELLAGSWKNPTALAVDALGFANTMRDNGVTGGEVESFVGRFYDWLETRERGKTEKNRVGAKLETVKRMVNNLERLPVLARLADEFQRRKRDSGVIEFSDQVATAAQILQQDPSIAADIRMQSKLVILDEYQDTSVGQTALFSRLFADHGVMAVGDPKQSIYGWRGASAGNMARFHTDFRDTLGSMRREYTLSTSWRNDESVLVAANEVAAKLPESRQGVTLGPRPGAGGGRIHIDYFLTQQQESAAIAEWFAERFIDNSDTWSSKKGAVLVRARRQMAPIAEALRERGVPYRIVGLGGLLGTPEVIDLNCLLRAANDEMAGNELLRLLVGARFEIGLADIRALAALNGQEGRTRELRGSHHQQNESDSLIAALDTVPTLGAQRRKQLGFSDAGFARLCEAAQLLRDVRDDLTLPLVDLVDSTIRHSRLALEAEANPRKTVGQANLDAYLEAVRAYVSVNPAADVIEFLEWLDAAETADEHAEVDDVPDETGIVQITTMHSAKGLEWDAVAIPQLNDGTLPRISSGDGWFRRNELPYPLRQDRDDLPKFAGLDLLDADAMQRSDITLQELKLEFDPDIPNSFAAMGRLREEEEYRRLAYVATTRARTDLWLSACRWVGRTKTPRVPSRFLHEAVAALRTNGTTAAKFTTTVPLETLQFEPGTLELELHDGLALVPDQRPQDPTEAATAESANTPDLVASSQGLYYRGEDGIYTASGGELAERFEKSPLLASSKALIWPRQPMATEPLAQLRQNAAAVHRLVDQPDSIQPNRYDTLIDLLLAERNNHRAARSFDLPKRFGASYFHELLENAERSALNHARPMPQRPSAATLIGNLFHGWVESLFTDLTASARYLDGLEPGDDELSDVGLARASESERSQLEQFKTTFLASRFAPTKLRPAHVELPIDAPLGERTVVGKIDAIYEHPDGAVEIVDWKTGRFPREPEQQASRQLQLMLYAHAYAESYRVTIERIRITLYYLADDRELSSEKVLPRDDLLNRLKHAEQRARESLSSETGDEDER